MRERELYQQKLQAQLDEWKAEVDKLRARASGASADAQLDMNQQIREIESQIEAGETKLTELAEASDDAWESIKDGFESAWGSIKAGFGDAAERLKR